MVGLALGDCPPAGGRGLDPPNPSAWPIGRLRGEQRDEEIAAARAGFDRRPAP